MIGNMMTNLLREYIREVMEIAPKVQPESQIYCDMDGVLVDFETAVVAMINNLLDGGQLMDTDISSQHRMSLNKT